MQVEIRNGSKTVEVWLTRREEHDPAVWATIRPLYKQYQNTKYLVAVFLSGENSLYEQTSRLLCDNRRRLAERQVQQNGLRHRTES